MSCKVELAKRWMRLMAGDRLMRGVGAMGLGELVIRLSRIVTAIVLARHLSPVDLGIAAAAITCFEMVRVLANNGLGQLVIRSTDDCLQATCNAAWRWTWGICIAMAAVQMGAGTWIAHSAGRPELVWMIGCLSAVYLIMPFGLVQAWILQREGRMGRIASVNALQVSTDNLLTAVLAFAGLGPWAIVLPKVLTAPIWMIGMRWGIDWRRDPSAGVLSAAETWRYSGPILLSEILSAVRLNCDKLLVGNILGLEALGIYYFAFSAGYGLSLVLTNALAAASFPHLADFRLSGRELLDRFDRALRRLALPIGLVICAQAAAVFVYVPILFGARWQPYVGIVAILALSAAAKPSYDLSAQLLRAAGMPALELAGSLVVTVLLLGSFAAALPFGLVAGVTALSVATLAVQPMFAVWSRRRVVRDRLPSMGANLAAEGLRSV